MKSFSHWLSINQAEETNVNEESLLREIKACRVAVKNQSSVEESVEELELDMQQLTSTFEEFKRESRAKSKMFVFWEEYGTMVNALLQFIKAERMGNWDLHLTATANMLPYFFSMNRPNYARWLPVYLADTT